MPNYYDNKDYDPVDQIIELVASGVLLALSFIVLVLFFCHLEWMGVL